MAENRLWVLVRGKAESLAYTKCIVRYGVRVLNWQIQRVIRRVKTRTDETTVFANKCVLCK